MHGINLFSPGNSLEVLHGVTMIWFDFLKAALNTKWLDNFQDLNILNVGSIGANIFLKNISKCEQLAAFYVLGSTSFLVP